MVILVQVFVPEGVDGRRHQPAGLLFPAAQRSGVATTPLYTSAVGTRAARVQPCPSGRPFKSTTSGPSHGHCCRTFLPRQALPCNPALVSRDHEAHKCDNAASVELAGAAALQAQSTYEGFFHGKP